MQDHIFAAAAAGNGPNRIIALDMLKKLAMPDPQIAYLTGAFDWGVPMGNIPNYLSTVPRMSYLERVQEHVAVTDTTTEPPRVILGGQTGTEKSVIASRLLPTTATSTQSPTNSCAGSIAAKLTSSNRRSATTLHN